MTRRNKWVLGSGLTMGLLLLLGAKPHHPVQKETPTVTAEDEARLWIEDLGEVSSSGRGYSEEYGAVVWRVEGANTTVIMDESYDLVGLEFH